MSPSPELQGKLKLCDLEVVNFVAELQLENAKLQKKIAKFEVEKITSKNRITALQEELNKLKKRVDTPCPVDLSKYINRTTPKEYAAAVVEAGKQREPASTVIVKTNSEELKKLIEEP